MTLGMGLVGPGFIAAHHLDAVRRLGNVEVIGIAGSSLESTKKRARELNAGRAYAGYRELLADPAVHVVHNTTPNHLHREVSLAALRAGKHVISDKPLAATMEESRELYEAARDANLAHVVTFNYRGYPLVQQARAMIAKGKIGKSVFVHGCYLQDWLTDERAYTWRLDPKLGGASSALGDIGSHWCDLAEHVTGARIVEVLADLHTVVAEREVPDTAAKAFAGKAKAPGKKRRITSEDVASVLLRFDNGARGCVTVGQVLPGHKNDLRLEVNGREGSIAWRQEQPNELWLGHHAKANTVLTRDPALMDPTARGYAHLPAGHPEAWADAFRNIIADAYAWIRRDARADAKPIALPTFADGYRNSLLVDAMLRSHAAGGVWQPVTDPLETKRTTRKRG
ncbi:Predicted dehydrogenase [Luteibacter sp. UNCMF331Sha3.1]|uniref:Gfo/Idh/MocA family protein n=1 Tax=Luteibacter sp. UNCMF331Sha3.1 TaxID=1502760 RepID=UPI0008B70B64|nr:Gfo/Idh/MocA family oxidoreductase [Luteibacter sp. UNCMF331Sha3.1]SEM49193.1 Predicted dehydrogenase [Luteibacter sp. UNCMF331Sha3.1]